jgi:hypothetical protein
MQDGGMIRIKDMTDEHLCNTIRLLDRRHQNTKEMTPYPNFISDGAQVAAENEYASFMDSEPGDRWPIYNDLVEEASRRGLDPCKSKSKSVGTVILKTVVVDFSKT